MIDTFVHSQLAPEAALAVHPVRLHHLRTAHGRREVDLVADFPSGRIAGIEAAAAVSRHDARHLAWLRDELGGRLMAAPISTIRA